MAIKDDLLRGTKMVDQRAEEYKKIREKAAKDKKLQEAVKEGPVIKGKK